MSDPWGTQAAKERDKKRVADREAVRKAKASRGGSDNGGFKDMVDKTGDWKGYADRLNGRGN